MLPPKVVLVVLGSGGYVVFKIKGKKPVEEICAGSGKAKGLEDGFHG